MKTLVIYDGEGCIISQSKSNNPKYPVGIDYIEQELVNQIAVSVDISTEPHTLVLIDTELSTDDEVKILKQQDTDLELAIIELYELILGGV